MSIAQGAIEKPVLTWMLILILLLGGIWGFSDLGRLEDPAFTLKQALVVTQYPGATAQQVAEEVSEPLESAIQKMAEVDFITSRNQPGRSTITIDIKPTYDGNELPAIWKELRNRVADAALELPNGVAAPLVNDDFGDVFGLFYAVTAPGYSDAERHDIADFLRRELLTVANVADVELAGLPEEAIFVEPSMPIALNTSVAPDQFVGAIANANSVVQSGYIDTSGGRQVDILSPLGSQTVEDIAGLSIGIGSGEILNLRDVARVHRSRKPNPEQIIRFNGHEAFTLGIAGLSTANIVEVGHSVDRRLAALQDKIPAGVDVLPIYQQHRIVEKASNDFLINLILSVTIVVVVLALFMGWRAAVVVGGTLLLTIVGTLFFMAIFSIEMERISLGALIIAMGMLVDNAIVVAEGMQEAMRQGQRSTRAAREIGTKTQTPLLGATIIGIMAFAGIGLSPDATGEFLFSLFAVIGISLLLSWVLAITATPLLGHYLFSHADQHAATDSYDGALFRAYGRMLRRALHARWAVLLVLAAITLACFAAFGQIKQQFFPDSNTPMLFAHYQMPQGSTVEQTARNLEQVEGWLLERQEVTSVATFAGRGATRFMLTYPQELPDPAYGHLIIQTHRLDQIAPLRAALDGYAAEHLVEGEFRTARLVFGPGGGAPIEARISGPDPVVLRELAEAVSTRMAESSDQLLHIRTNWREQELSIRPTYATNRAQHAGVTRENIAESLKFSTEGMAAGFYREGDRQIPIIVRKQRDDPGQLIDQVVYSSVAQDFIPIEQLIDNFVYQPLNTMIHRRDRVPTITISADIPAQLTAASVFSQIRAPIENMSLPLGYSLAWGGEFENASKAQASLGAQLPLSFLIMVVISVLLFNGLKQPLVIWLLVPMAVNGVTLGLLGTGLPFTFTALLGLLSLSGMLIKNGIVLVEEIDHVRRQGVELTQAIVRACTSRVRPVLLAAITTILGMAPLLTDAFFKSMAITIMGGLAFATILTLVAAPVLYHLLLAPKRTKPFMPDVITTNAVSQ